MSKIFLVLVYLLLVNQLFLETAWLNFIDSETLLLVFILFRKFMFK